MVLAHRRHRFTAEEYFLLEEKSRERHEFFDGEIYDMAGASATHDTIVFNLTLAIGNPLVQEGNCQLHTSDMQVEVDDLHHYTYPDLSVVCGTPIYHDENERTLLNPTLLIEVQSPTTEDYDRGEKFKQYRGIASLQEYMLVSQETAFVTVHRKGSSGKWSSMNYIGLETVVALTSIGCKLTLAQIYRRVQFSPPVPPSA